MSIDALRGLDMGGGVIFRWAGEPLLYESLSYALLWLMLWFLYRHKGLPAGVMLFFIYTEK